MSKFEVTVRLDRDRKDDPQKIITALKDAGLSNVSFTNRFGIVHGEIEPSDEDALKRVDGVASVRVSQTFRTL